MRYTNGPRPSLTANTILTSASWAAAFSRGPAQTGSYPASRFSCSTAWRASASPHHRLPGRTRALPSSGYSDAKLTLNDLAVGPFVFDFTNSALEAKPAGGTTPYRFVASITVLPSRPPTVSSASAIAPPGTASRTTSASETSPPSRPNRVTVWPARSHRTASPPPTLPLPTTVIRIEAVLSP